MKQTFTMPTGEVLTKDFPQFKTPWNHDTNWESDRTATFCADESLTRQEFVQDQDINTILERFTKTGEPPNIALPEHFLDTTDKVDYFTMATRLAEATATFYELPAEIRNEHLNDPARWADQVVKATKNGNRERMEELGLKMPTRKPQDGEPPDPLPETTPASGTGKTPPGAPKD